MLLLGEREFWHLEGIWMDALGRRWSWCEYVKVGVVIVLSSKLSFLWPGSWWSVFVWHWGTPKCGWSKWVNNPTEPGVYLYTWNLMSHIELALEAKKMSSGERRRNVVVEKEGKDKLFERAVTPLLCSTVQEKRKQECVLYCSVEAARV